MDILNSIAHLQNNVAAEFQRYETELLQLKQNLDAASAQFVEAETARITAERELHNLRNSTNIQIAALETKLRDKTEAHKKATSELREEHAAELATARKKHTAELNEYRDSNNDFDEQLTCVEAKLREKDVEIAGLHVIIAARNAQIEASDSLLTDCLAQK